ncbi:S41 family peptidase [Chitinophaga sancti]|uniref:N-terminal domain of Peptidase_S41 n=1 Tax=Chitinophaga sancti TaxID=1004 RepID=A0A1K1SKM1_9BACT|nr:S41 family peptidase [Chitinophaga sancti]WQD65480.1 S41 family peptidase [Chitinophaga sancti]WQG88897.1 S41 family peptidase [Chitinophaga sancti]SFW84846.1 N-terminal domain of Peptidase_S41 [Chitinophaga sancti]
MKALAYLLLLVSAPAMAQDLGNSEKSVIIDAVSQKLKTLYVYPETAEKMAKQLRTNLDNKKYADVKDPNAFSEQLTMDLQAISHDRHLAVFYDPRSVESHPATMGFDPASAKNKNFGFKELRILDGNIGYLNLSYFEETMKGGETAVQAMNFLSNADALIIDLRANGGGATDMVQLLASYLFEGEPQPLTDIYWRPTNSLTQYRTLPYVSGKRLPHVDVYLLTSQQTFSAAEDFSYSLQNLKRVTIIGETTGGGAHPVEQVLACEHFLVRMPEGRSISAITKTDWEGTGVKPDIEVPAKDALLTAQLKALTKAPESNFPAKWALAAIKAKLTPVLVSEDSLKAYAGNYGERMITIENGQLYFQKRGGAKNHLIAMDKDLFSVEDKDYLRIRFDRKDGVVIGFTRLYDDGTAEPGLKDR